MQHLDWRFFPTIDNLDPSTAYHGSYNPGLIILSVAVATLAAFVALSISGRIVASTSRGARWAWASAGATAMGGGIWGMHFIGMLAFTLPCGVSYEPAGTLLSMIPGVLASGVALNTISHGTDPGYRRLGFGALLMGAGIGLMHYSGMAAMEPEALLRYDPRLVFVSIVVAVGLAFLSLSIRFSFRGFNSPGIAATLVAATVMGCAVAGMHYTAMGAAIFFPFPDGPATKMAMSPLFLAMLITIFIGLIMALTLLATFAGRQVDLAQSLAAEVAERKRTEVELIGARSQAEAANRAKSQFLAAMSHEIRTPMNGVLGIAALLAATPLNQRQAYLIEKIGRSGQALLGIINDILDLSKIEAGHLTLASHDFDVRELVAEVTDLFCEQFSNKDVEFIYFVAEDVPRRLVGDPARFRQVLVNLVGNAAKFTESGEITIELTLAEINETHVTLLSSVTDTGIGIAREERERIFESFHQVDSSTTRARGGTGLGLSIVKELVHRMGGRIDVQSELGQGSRFAFTARLGRSPLPLGASDGTRSIDRRLRVLVADGNSASGDVMSRYFSDWHIDGVVRQTAAEAEALWHEAATRGQPFDVAIIDVKGLRCDGLELARRIREAPHSPRTEVILLIGLDGSIADSDVEGVGAFALLAKPPRPSVLFDCLASIASGARENGVVSFYLRRNARQSRVAFGGRILLIEDNPVNQDVASGFLENFGCSVAIACNGKAGIEIFARERFDLVLMDCEMPVMDGFDATRRIRQIEDGATESQGAARSRRRTPIVALTAHALAEVRARCLDGGMDDFLIKPFDEQQMIEVLGRWLEPAASTVSPGTFPPVDRDIALQPNLDMTAIQKILAISGKGGAGLLTRVAAQFKAVSEPLLATIRSTASDGDAEGVWRAAHSLKSSASAVGACLVSQHCSAIEMTARETGGLPAADTLADLETDLLAATQELDELIGTFANNTESHDEICESQQVRAT